MKVFPQVQVTVVSTYAGWIAGFTASSLFSCRRVVPVSRVREPETDPQVFQSSTRYRNYSEYFRVKGTDLVAPGTTGAARECCPHGGPDAAADLHGVYL